MILHPLARILLVAALVVQTTSAAALEYVCAMDGKVHRSRCCENKAHGERDRVELSKRDCCELRPASDAPATQPAARLSGGQAPLVVPVIGVISSTSQVSSRSFSPNVAPTATGPPIFLRNCSILC